MTRTMTAEAQIRRVWRLTAASCLVIAAAAALLLWMLTEHNYVGAAVQAVVIAANVVLLGWQSGIRARLRRLTDCDRT